jgi:hypothetical protein
MAEAQESARVAPWTRVVILLAALIAACGLSLYATGSVIPTSARDALIFQSTLLFVVLGSAVLEHKFTRPADSVVNGLMGMVSLVTVASVAPKAAWWSVFLYCAFVFVLALTCTVVSSSPAMSGWRRAIAEATYKPAVVFGRARVLYSVVFLFGVFAFYGVQDRRTGILVLFWGIFIALWPLGVPELLSSFHVRRRGPSPIEKALRLDSPNLLRIKLEPTCAWQPDSPAVYEAADGSQHIVVPLYSQTKGEDVLATGMCVPSTAARISGLARGNLYTFPASAGLPSTAQTLGGNAGAVLLGFVIEDSTIGSVRFETWRSDVCREGLVMWCRQGESRVFYQITEGATREESLEGDRHGFQYAVATQLGVLKSGVGFVKHNWVPVMNTPVFWDQTELEAAQTSAKEGDFVYGTLPGTKISVGGPFADVMDHHTAILGVTGTGKTELAFDLIRHVLAAGHKVVCIDLTARYRDRVADLDPSDLSISTPLADELSKKLFEAETGAYGAGKEKQALKAFSDKLRDDVSKRLQAFLTSTDSKSKLGLITLDEISNTKATLFITELYLTCLLHFARDHSSECPRVLIVVEEAHTVMPEPSTMGLGDHDSRGLVSKISQIALQGRKYGVGLLVIAQRTATVSKSVLTQCNTVISLNSFDETSLTFLANFYGEPYKKIIPNLPRLHAIIFGRAVRTERPVVVEIPYVAAKDAPPQTTAKTKVDTPQEPAVVPGQAAAAIR